MREKAGDKSAFPGPLKKILEQVSSMVLFCESWNNKKFQNPPLHHDAATTNEMKLISTCKLYLLSPSISKTKSEVYFF